MAYPDYVADLSQRVDVDIAVKWFDPRTHDVSTRGRSGEVRHVLDGREVPYVARPYKTILLSLDCFQYKGGVAQLAAMFDLSVTGMKALIKSLPETNGIVKDVQVNGNRIEWTLAIGQRVVREENLDRLQGSVSAAVLVELATAHARHHARVEPTFLLVDGLFGRFVDSRAVGSTLDRLETAAEHAQVAIISSMQEAIANIDSWSIATLDAARPAGPYNALNFEVHTKANSGRT
ncbi:hypothetical protein [Actinoplanes lobatus]|uniref:Uncharacterized protein n=1 Tax=Actinoplanes lobatus TaxID=113568 RepID=A0A7W7HGC5_9ACTN|nr:hypothetical protein [Actinoplanes lobatus]MBB4750056.1 hypothetical protein [Actinoplanes lobatus]